MLAIQVKAPGTPSDINDFIYLLVLQEKNSSDTKKISYDEANDILNDPRIISYFNMHFYIYL